VVDFITGLGGREISKKTVADIVQKAEELFKSGLPLPDSHWVGLNLAILS
jgi:hypothetical protein